MNFKELKEIIDLVTSKEEIEELELEKSGVRLRIKRSSNHAGSRAPGSVATGTTATLALDPPSPPPPVALQTEEDLFYIKSPIVGTFYQAPLPTSEPIVSGVDFVEKGTAVGMIEVMKLMKEIESDVTGEVIGILVENGPPVESGALLCAVR